MATQAEDVQTDDKQGEDQNQAANEGGEAQLTEIEQLAVEQGWKPKDQYSGPEEKWKPARDWLAAEHDISRSLRREVRGLKDTVERMASASTRQTERALKEQAKEIEARFQEAVANKDTAGATAAVNELRKLEREATTVDPAANAEADFAARNPWYGKDEDATAFAVSICQREAAKNKSIPDQLEAVDAAVRKRFPELFNEQKREPKPQPGVNQPSNRGTLTMKREPTLADLPAAAQKAAREYAKLFKERHGKPEEESIKNYVRDYLEVTGSTGQRAA